MARPDEWVTSGPFGIIAYVRDQVVPAMTGERVCIDYDGMARDLTLTAAGGFAGGFLLKSTYDGARRLGSWLFGKGGRTGAEVGQLGAVAENNVLAGLARTDFPDIARQISQKQLRHVAGRAEYRGGGYMGSMADAQAVLDAYHGGSATVLGRTTNGAFLS